MNIQNRDNFFTAGAHAVGLCSFSFGKIITSIYTDYDYLTVKFENICIKFRGSSNPPKVHPKSIFKLS